MTALGIVGRIPVDSEPPSLPLPAVHSTGPEPPQIRLPGLDDFEQRCWQQFTEAATFVYAALHRQLLDTHGLTLLDVMVLRRLANSDKGAARMGELAQALAVIPSRVSQQIRRLESRGLVSRSKSCDDRRVVIASITPEGQAKLKPVLRTYARSVRALYLNSLSRQQMTALGDSSRRIDSALRDAGLPTKPNDK
jgi:DNA-binding MarR family transcriptional regulator